MTEKTFENLMVAGFLLFGLVLVALLCFCARYDQARNKECQAKGGVYVSTDSGSICIDKKSVIK